MRIHHLFVVITLFLTCPFHLLGNDQLDPPLCYTPDGSTRAPDWVCGAPVDGYSESAVGAYLLDKSAYRNRALAQAIMELISSRGLAEDSSNATFTEDTTYYKVEGEIKAKIIQDFFTEEEGYILVVAAEDGDTYYLTSYVTSYADKSDNGSDLFKDEWFLSLDRLNDNLSATESASQDVSIANWTKRSKVICTIMGEENGKFFEEELDSQDCLLKEMDLFFREEL